MFIISFILAFSFQGTRGLYDSTETRYAESAREMIQTGNYLEPQLAYKHHWTKPPMIYWAIAGGMLTFGQNEWGARIPNAIAFCLLVFLVLGMAQTLNPGSGILAGLIFATSPLSIGGAFNLSADLLLTLFETAAMFCFVKAEFEGKGRKNWLILMWAAFGLAFLTKGPVGLLPLLVIFVFKKLNKSKYSTLPIEGLIIFLLIGLSWYLAVEIRNPGLLKKLAYEEIFLRNTTNRFNRNPEWYKMFTVIILPLFLGVGIWAIYYPKILKEKLFNLLPRPQRLLLGVWLVIPLIPFCLSRSRLPLYILPLLIPLSVFLALFIKKIETNFLRPLKIGIISFFILLIGKGVWSYLPHKNNTALFKDILTSHTIKNFYGLEEIDFHGPLFYLKGQIKTITLPQIFNEDLSDASLLLVKNQNISLIEDKFHKMNIPFELKKFKEWAVFLFGNNL